MGNVQGFLPSQNGLHYINRWPDVPDLKIPTPFGEIAIGSAAGGLCGGMAFAVRDLFEAHLLPTASKQNPASNTPAFEYLTHRLFESFNIPSGVLKFYQWMNLPQDNSFLGLPGLSWMVIHEEMPKIRACIDQQRICPIGLLRSLSRNPSDLGKNHQVVVWGYEEQGKMTTIRLYDPNWPDRDDITISFDHSDPTHTTSFVYSTGEPNNFGFFANEYSWKDPAPLLNDGSRLGVANAIPGREG